MGSLTGVEAPVLAFEASLRELAVATGDGRVKLFSVPQQRLTADLTKTLAGKASAASPSSDIYTCLAWGAKGPSQRLLFAGTTSGQVKCVDVATTELRWCAPASVDGSVAALACSPDGSGGLLVLGKAGGAAVLDVATGAALSSWRASKHALSAALMLPGGRAVVAGSAVAVHDAASGARLHKWTGHATPVAALAATPNGDFCCSAAQGERSVAVWALEASASGKLKHKSAVAQLNLDQPAVHLAMAPAATDSGAFHVAAVTGGGGLRLFECTPAAGGRVDVRQWAASAAEAGVLVAAVEAADGGGASLVIAAGTTALPVFQSVRVEKPDPPGVAPVPVSVPEGVGLVAGPQGGAPGGKAAKHAVQQGVAVLGAGEATNLAARFAAGGAAKRGAAAAELDDAAGLPGDAVTPMDEDAAAGLSGSGSEDEGPTFAERVAALQDAAAGGAGDAPSASAVAVPAGPIKADSLAVLLTQALQSGDRALLERCLAVRSEDVVNNTVRRLAPQDANAFLRMAVQRLQSSPARGEQLAVWIRAVLLHHTAYLAGAAGAQGTLGYLYQLIEARLASYQPLLALSGRLDLVLANAKRAGGAGEEGEEAVGRPLVAVEVGSDGGVEVEDAFAGAALESDEESEGWESSEGEEGGSDVEDVDGANGLEGSSGEESD